MSRGLDYTLRPPARYTMEESPDTRGFADSTRLAILAACAVVLALSFALVELYTLDGGLGFPLDDSWIHLAFARNLADGEGLAVVPGKPVAGSTAPLWTALAALGAAWPVSDPLWLKLLGILFHVAGVLLTWSLARHLGLSRNLATLAALLVAATGWLSWAALSGMEISLFIFLSLAGAILHLEERNRPCRPPLSMGILGLSALARPEGLVLLAMAAADRLVAFRRGADEALEPSPLPHGIRPLVRGLGLAALAVAPVALFYVSLEGAPVPTTLAAKTDGGASLHLPDLGYLYRVTGILLQPMPWLAVLAPAGCVSLVRRLGTPNDRGLLPALWLFGLPLAYACITPIEGPALVGKFGRYLFPLFPFVAVLGVLGLESIAAAFGPRERAGAGRRMATAVALAVLCWPVVTATVRTASLYAQNLADVQSGGVRMARWLAERTPEEAVIATMDIGALAALLPNPILDIAGIADPEVHAYVRRARDGGGTWQDGVLRFLADRRPDYLVVFPDWLTAVEREGSPYHRLHVIHVPENVTLGRDTLVLYGTPWTRYPLQASADAFDPAEPETGPPS